jgi:hypothetical protein
MEKSTRSRTVRRRALLLFLASALTASGALARPAAATGANASDVSLRGCQSTTFRLNMTDNSQRRWSCSGVKSVYANARSFNAGGWSGIIYYGANSTWAFCDGESANLGPAYVRYVDIYATRASWCR